ncbi:MAG: hypothetical protein ACR2NO_08965 [Chloroflexota bacterium]
MAAALLTVTLAAPSLPTTTAWSAPRRDTAETASPAFAITSDEEGTWVWVPAWAEQVEDPALLRALQIASTFNRPWRDQVAVYLSVHHTRIGFGPLPGGAGGAYDAAADRITLNNAVRYEPPGVLAALLAHEVYHAVIARLPGSAACLSEETYAFSWQAATWAYLPDRWHGRTSWSRWHDFLVSAWRRSALPDAVESLPGYSLACGVSILP